MTDKYVNGEYSFLFDKAFTKCLLTNKNSPDNVCLLYMLEVCI